MNCKPGDLAFIVNSTNYKKNDGLIVEVLRAWAGEKTLVNGVPRNYAGGSSPAWVCRSLGRPMISTDSLGDRHEQMERPIPDRNLRPIRDQPGADETLNWADVPKVAPQPVTEAG